MICAVCDKPIDDRHPDELEEFQINGKPVHEECWYEALGKIVEEHPVVSPIRGHGFALN